MLGLLFIVAFIGTVFPLAAAPETGILLTSLATLSILRLFGLRWAILATALAGIYTIALLQHPLVAILLLVEILTVGSLRQRGVNNLLVADLLFWLGLGLPLLWLGFGIMLERPGDSVLNLMALTCLNGLGNALGACLLQKFMTSLRPANSFNEQRLNLLSLLFLMPAVLAVLINMNGMHDLLRPGLQSALAAECLRFEQKLQAQQGSFTTRLEQLGRLALKGGQNSPGEVKAQADKMLRDMPEIVGLRVFDATGACLLASGSSRLASEHGPPGLATAGVTSSALALVRTLPWRNQSNPSFLCWYLPLREGTEERGLLHADLNLETWRGQLLAITADLPFAMSLLDGIGQTVLRSVPADLPLSGEMEPAAGAQSASFLWSPDNNSLTALPFWSKLQPGSLAGHSAQPLSLLVEIPDGQHRSRLQKLVLDSLSLMVLPAVALLLLLGSYQRRLSETLQNLASALAQLPGHIREGTLPGFSPAGFAELEPVADHLRDTVTTLRANFLEIEVVKAQTRQRRVEDTALHNWEVYATGRKLRSERTRRMEVEDLLEQLETAESKYRFLVEKSRVGVFILQGVRFCYVNPRFGQIFGYSTEELTNGRSLTDLIFKADRAAIFLHLRAQLRGENTNQQFEIRGVCRDHRVIQVEVLYGRGSYNGAPAVIGTLIDITERKMAEETIRHLAYHDSLTDLPNRTLFADRLEKALSTASRNHELLALLFLDLDRFKAINDTLGHGIGDGVLREVANRLKSCVRAADTVSRFGGDEFNILLTQVHDQKNVAAIAQKALASLQQPFHCEGHEMFVTGSIGIALYPRDGRDAQTLIRNADTALFRAKDLGRNNSQLYAPAMNALALERMELENGLRRVLERQELRLHYQPQMDLRSGRIVGVEALARWEHPMGSYISPLIFIPMAEEIGLIFPIGEWVLRTACRQARQWQEMGYPELRIGVNVSAQQFQAQDFLETVTQIVGGLHLEPALLNLEITESALMSEVQDNLATLAALRLAGITVAVDDFGVGYSSLRYLKDFPLTHLKIDSSFVRNLPENENDVSIARMIIEMAHSLGIRVIAEGVEREEQISLLRALDCDEVQGFWCSKPLPAEELIDFLLDHQRIAGAPSLHLELLNAADFLAGQQGINQGGGEARAGGLVSREPV